MTRRMLLTLGILLLSTGCTTTQLFQQGSTLRRIQFEGDSITWQSTADINARFGPTNDVAINAMVGTDTLLETDAVRAEAAVAPDIEIINLGTNDAAHILDPPSYEAGITVADVTGRLDTFAAEFPPSTCVVFVTVNTHTTPGWGPDYARQIDDHIRTFAHVVDWDGAWSTSYFDTAGGVHPNETGRQALLDLEAQAIAAC